MIDAYLLYAVPGWGSVLAEAMLTWCDAPFQIEDVTGFDQPGPARDRLLAVNPLAQLPTLRLPGGAILTESAAIALHLSERYPQAGLAPPPNAPDRPAFLHRLVWLVANVYPTFTYGDYPERWTDAPDSLRASTDAHRKRLWRQFEADVGSRGPWVLGERFSALDLYVGAMTRWQPRRDWFAEHCPALSAIAARVDALPTLAPVWARNFPG